MLTVLLSIVDPLVLLAVIGCALLRDELKAAIAIVLCAVALLGLGAFLQADEARYVQDVDFNLGPRLIGVLLWCYVGRAIRWTIVKARAPRPMAPALVVAQPAPQPVVAPQPITLVPTIVPAQPVETASLHRDADTMMPNRPAPSVMPPLPPPPLPTLPPALPPTMRVTLPVPAMPVTMPVTMPVAIQAAPPPLPAHLDAAPAVTIAPAAPPIVDPPVMQSRLEVPPLLPLSGRATPQAGRKRQIYSAPVGRIGTDIVDNEKEMLAALDGTTTVMMMGDNPALPAMPERPKLMDFFRLRFGDITFRHLLLSAKTALDAGQDEKIVIACLLHDIANGALVRSDHGYWGAQLIAPYVADEVAWAVQYHQALRYFADESVGYQYPASYLKFFGPDYVPPDYIARDHETARRHRWYMSARLVTIYDIYSFEKPIDFDPEIFTDLIGRNFRQPAEGLGFDNSPTAHMWRSMIWPNNFL